MWTTLWTTPCSHEVWYACSPPSIVTNVIVVRFITNKINDVILIRYNRYRLFSAGYQYDQKLIDQVDMRYTISVSSGDNLNRPEPDKKILF